MRQHLIWFGCTVLVWVSAGCGKRFADDLPEGCPAQNAITVRSSEVSAFEVKQAWYSTWSGSDGSLVFTNYEDYDPASIYGHKVTGKEARVVIKLARADKGTLEKGRYEAGYQKDPKPARYASEFNISTEKLSGGVFDQSGFVEFTHLGPKYTCGTIQADDGKSSIQGSFVTHFKKVQ